MIGIKAAPGRWQVALVLLLELLLRFPQEF